MGVGSGVEVETSSGVGEAVAVGGDTMSVRSFREMRSRSSKLTPCQTTTPPMTSSNATATATHFNDDRFGSSGGRGGGVIFGARIGAGWGAQDVSPTRLPRKPALPSVEQA
jgi:hypothetical protein